MVKQLKLILLVTLIVIHCGQQHNCKVKFVFQKVCNRVVVNDECQPPFFTANCKRLKTLINERKCPIYDCVSKIYT
jgi:hypothetical protein